MLLVSISFKLGTQRKPLLGGIWALEYRNVVFLIAENDNIKIQRMVSSFNVGWLTVRYTTYMGAITYVCMNHSRYGPFPLWASRYGPHGGRYGPPR